MNFLIFQNLYKFVYFFHISSLNFFFKCEIWICFYKKIPHHTREFFVAKYLKIHEASFVHKYVIWDINFKSVATRFHSW